MAYSPLGKGFLTGAITETTNFDSSDMRNATPRMAPEARKANQVFVELLQEIAGQKGATPAQVALAWLLAQKPWVIPIPGTTKLDRLVENISALELELSVDDLSQIEAGASTLAVHGNRYSDAVEGHGRPLGIDDASIQLSGSRVSIMKTIGYAAQSATSPLAPFTFERRTLRANDVAMDILYCGVCHSDLHQIRNDWGIAEYPMVPGHEIVGRVIDSAFSLQIL